MSNIIAFPRLQADTCRLHNRYYEMRGERLMTDEEWRLIDPPKDRSFPTPFGWFLIGLAMISGGRRQ
jgi:hypothetical protein